MAVTPNYRFPLPRFDKRGWQNEYYNFARMVDAIFAKFVAINNVQGVWQNSTAYEEGVVVVDPDLGLMFRCAVTHTSPAAGAFGEARLANPTYWGSVTTSTTNRGPWITDTEYFVGDFVTNGQQYAVCLVRHVSTVFATDVADEKWSVLLDLTQALTDAATAASDAEASAIAADASAIAAGNSASAAQNAKTDAENAKAAAEGAQNAAEDAQAAAELAEANTQSLYNSFRGVYYGALSADPSVDPLGNPVGEGDWYWNTTTKRARIYNGSAFEDISIAQLSQYVFTAAGGETSISGVDDNGNTLSYTVGFVWVFKNGMRLVSGDDYTATDGTSINFTVALSGGDVITIDAFSPFTLTDALDKYQNLADLPDKPTARSNLGLGTAAVATLGTGSGQVPTADDIPGLTPLPVGYGYGIQISNNFFYNPTYDIEFSAGTVRDDSNTVDLTLATFNIKQLDVEFAEYILDGIPSGGRAAADNLTGAKWFRCWVIGGPGKNTQGFFSTSANPTLPSGFTWKAHRGWIYWDGSTIKEFTQIGRNRFNWVTEVEDWNVSNPSTSAVLRTVTAPPNTIARLNIGVRNGTTNNNPYRVWETSKADAAPTATTADVVSPFSSTASWAMVEKEVVVNASSQVRTRIATSGGADGITGRCMGFIDPKL